MISLGIMLGLVAMICWGIADFLQAIPIRKIGSLKTIFFSNLLGTAATFAVIPVYIYLKGIIYIDWTDFLLVLGMGVIDLVAIYYFTKSFEIGEVSVVAPISASYSLVTVVLAFLFLGEQMEIVKIAAIVLIVTGIILTSTDLRKLRHLHSAKGVRESVVTLVMWGVYFFVLSIVSRNLSSIFIQEFGMGSMAAKIATAMNVFIFTGIVNGILMTSFAYFKGGVVSQADLKEGILNVFLADLFLYTFAWLVINFGFVVESVSIVTSVSSLYPALTVILAVIFFKDKLVLNQKIGIVTVLAGIFLISL